MRKKMAEFAHTVRPEIQRNTAFDWEFNDIAAETAERHFNHPANKAGNNTRSLKRMSGVVKRSNR